MSCTHPVGHTKERGGWSLERKGYMLLQVAHEQPVVSKGIWGNDVHASAKSLVYSHISQSLYNGLLISQVTLSLATIIMPQQYRQYQGEMYRKKCLTTVEPS